MGILSSLLGAGNPVAQFADANHGWLSSVGAGLAQGPTFSAGLANAARLGPAGQLIDQQTAKDAQDKADRQNAINQSSKDLQKWPDLMQAVASKAITPAEAYGEAWKRSAPGYGDPSYGKDNNFSLKAGETEFGPDGKVIATVAAPQDTTATDVAGAIINGDQPPDLKGLYKYGSQVRAELGRQGYDFTKASEDWNATQKNLASMNGPQQLRLRQAVSISKETVGKVEQLYGDWQSLGLSGQYKTLNRGSLEAAKQGLLGPQAASAAQNLEAEINDLTSELGTVYKGGNSSTDESLKLAATQLAGNWDEQTFKNAVKLVKSNIQYRENSLKQPTAGITDSQYDPNAPAAVPSVPPGPAGTPLTGKTSSGLSWSLN